ncbi:hypothetical protein ACJX0J_015637, partial [Zea mays]
HVWRTRTSPRRRHSDDECRRKKTVAAGRRQGGWRPPLSRSNWRFWSAPSATGLSSLRCSSVQLGMRYARVAAPSSPAETAT